MMSPLTSESEFISVKSSLGPWFTETIKKLTVIGDTVNIDSHIEAVNKEAETRLLISEPAYQELSNLVEVEDFVRLKLRGSSKRTTLYKIREIKPD